MAFDSSTRNKLGGMISEARQLLDKEFTEQFQQIYGIQPDGTIIDIEKLKHLDEQQNDTARILRERIDHLISGMVVEKKPVVIAIERTIREQAFTILNRFTALRMCEERGFVKECVRQGMQSKGFKVYETIAGPGLGGAYERYKTFLFCQFDEIAVDLGVLFDRFSPEGLLFPREQALVGLLKIINKEDLKKIWVEDETIGWVYQYFNSKEEREAMRKASTAPRNSRELAVRNQFFTPRYVVEFLTDNTLGRIWYEMRRGKTVLEGKCNYLVRRPSEIFLAPGEKAPIEEDHEDNLTQEELLKKTVYIERRPKKDPRDIKILDPACGSGHFLLYAFDLLETIYVEAWDDPECPKSKVTGGTIREDYGTLEELGHTIPDMILRWNLHGIDIDPRCAQIASLALWLRAQKSWQKQSLKAADRPKITKANIVTAEPMPGEEDIRREFIQSLEPRVLGQLVNVVFDKMKLAGETGPLLKIEEEIREVVAEARRQWEKSPEMEQVALFPHLLREQLKQEKLRFNVKEITDETFWNQAEDLILVALQAYAERTENGYATRRRLFIEDAVQGFSFIDLCRHKYDVVLMNPPYGESPSNAREYLKDEYRLGRPDAYMCFVFRTSDMLKPNGILGALISKTFMHSQFFQTLREMLLSEKSGLRLLLDLGLGVLDNATVSTCAVVTQKLRAISKSNEYVIFINQVDITDPSDTLEQISKNLSQISDQIYIRSWGWLGELPGLVFAYWLPNAVWKIFIDNPTIDWTSSLRSKKDKNSTHHTVLPVKQGLIPGDLFRFSRLSWEVSSNCFGLNKRWNRICKGGDFFKYFSNEDLLILWENNGREMKNFAQDHYGSSSRTIKNEEFYFKPGITYPRISSIGLNARIMPKDFIFTDAGPAIIPENADTIYGLLGFLNSRFADFCSKVLDPGRKYEIAHIASLPLNRKLLSNENIISFSKNAYEISKEFAALNETSSVFIHPSTFCTLQIDFPLSHLLKKTNDLLVRWLEKLAYNQSELNRETFRAYDIQNNDVDLIKSLLQKFGTDSIFGKAEKNLYLMTVIAQLWPENILEGKLLDKANFTGELIIDLLQYLIGCPLGRWDVRIIIKNSLIQKIKSSLDSIPICPPGMLVGPDGLPAISGNIVSEEWLRARPDVNTLPSEGAVKRLTISDSEYPVKIVWDGILVDDLTSQFDVINNIRGVLELLWNEKADAIERELCEILGIKNLRDYFTKPSGFFADHLKRYSKSRRQAPIYWPLSTVSGSYTLWVYYPRMTDQSLFMCVQDFVEPKIKEVEHDIERLQQELNAGKKSIRDELDRLIDFRQELIDFRNELLRVAKLPYKANLNDGVMITASPLWKLFRHNQWRKDLEECWKKLESGEYDWAHLAYTIWPDRVREKCKKDRSIAIAHGLEELYEGELPESEKRKKKKKA
jgi:hypothetical protein